ncbi:MAG: HD domain-containing protein [Thermoanaerobaculia bacterium]|nr:HD domain-containing protein [Thermoanaerobaculia bacterium]MBP9826318.1 HD domain-containing protein [Thermoanaerobaculia bacterium]
MLTLRDPIHGFIETDALEAALVDSRPLQRLRFIHQLGLTFLVYPGAEHSRFSHVLGAMSLAGRMLDALLRKSPGLLGADERRRARRLVRLAALFHDAGHAPFSHSAEELFEGGIDHEAMTARLLASDEIQALFDRLGDGIAPADVAALLGGKVPPERRFLAQIISGELDVDKMDYLLRDSLYCGVRYGVYDLDRLLDTLAVVSDPETGALGVGVEEGGVHAIEALVLARYYMFTQVYFNVTGKALEQHLSEWMRAANRQWPADPEHFLRQDDLSTLEAMRASDNQHAQAVVHRRHFPLAFETREHLSEAESEAFESLLPALRAHYGPGEILVARSAKDPHRLGGSPVWVRYRDGHLESMESASHFIRHLTRIDRYRVYTRPEICEEVAAELRAQFLV